MSETTDIRVGLFGPVTDAWGGSGVGGLATHGTEIASALPEHGVRVTYLADNLHDSTDAPWGSLAGVAGARGRAEAIRDLLGAPAQARAIRTSAAHDPRRMAHGIPLTRAFTRALRIARACRRDGVNVLHVQQPDYRPLYAEWAHTGLPTLLAVHGLGVADADPGGPVELLVRDNLARAEITTAPSRFLAEAAIALGADADSMHIVPNAVDHDLFFPRDKRECRESLGLDPERPIAVFLGRAIHMKGADVLLEASRALIQAAVPLQTVFVGSWSLEAPPEAEAYRAGAQAPVLLREGADKPELPLWIGAADVVVVPSRYEGFGLVALEALACGRPLVASATGGLPEVAPEGTALFTAPGDVRGLAEAIRATLDDPADAAARAARGPAVAARYSWDAAAARYAALYRTLVARRSSAS